MRSMAPTEANYGYEQQRFDQEGLLNQGSKRLEIGYLNIRQPLKVYLFSEGFPVWLLALDVAWVSELTVCGHSSLPEFLLTLNEGEQAFVLLLLDPFLKDKRLSFLKKLNTMDSKLHMVLVSGTLFPYLLCHVEKYHAYKTLGVVDSHYEGRLRSGRPTGQTPTVAQRVLALANTSWQRFRHVSVGGATNFVSLFCRTHVDDFTTVSRLQRGIRHFLNASVKPGPPPKLLPPSRQGHFYLPEDRLIPGFYELPVLVSSDFHASGTGYRALSLEELASIHGFPRHQIVSNFPRSILDLPPVQLLSASLAAVWKIDVAQALETTPIPPKQHRDHETYLPNLQRFLPHDWVDASVITATASKADDAVSPCRLWDLRLELLFPGVTPHLEALRRGILIWIRRRLWREIREYMHRTFTSAWAADLSTLRHKLNLNGPQGGLLRGENGGKFHNVWDSDSDGWDSDGDSNGVDIQDGAEDVDVREHGIKGDFEGRAVNEVEGVDVNKDVNSNEVDGVVVNEDVNKFQRKRKASITSCTIQPSSDIKLDTSPSTSQSASMYAKRRCCPVTSSRSRKTKELSEGNSDTSQGNLLYEADKISEALYKMCGCSWWEWDVGSSLFYWRWGLNSVLARDGMIPFVCSNLPRNLKKGRSLGKNEHIDKIIEKLATIVKRGYIKPGFVSSLIDVFAVPKGDDIRLVYNGTSCGLNEATWAPNFWLPYPKTAIKLLDYDFHSADVDLGEMFLNFPLHRSLQSSSGIDLTPFQEKLGIGDGTKKLWYVWTRNWMGARLSPYSSVQYCSFAEEFVRGNHLDEDNALRYDVIVLNLPGSPTYDPSKPRVYKWHRGMGCLAGELVIFVDDCRVTARTLEWAWRIARQVCSRFQ